jgi:hypothetical protein
MPSPRLRSSSHSANMQSSLSTPSSPKRLEMVSARLPVSVHDADYQLSASSSTCYNLSLPAVSTPTRRCNINTSPPARLPLLPSRPQYRRLPLRSRFRLVSPNEPMRHPKLSKRNKWPRRRLRRKPSSNRRRLKLYWPNSSNNT